MQTETSTVRDMRALLQLNRDYIEAVRSSNVRWFEGVLTEDFRCSLPDGTFLNRQEFLVRAARPLDIIRLDVHDVEIRILGDAAIVHARTTFRTAEGDPASGRYTDVWSRQNGRWLAAAAHFTRRVDQRT